MNHRRRSVLMFMVGILFLTGCATFNPAAPLPTAAVPAVDPSALFPTEGIAGSRSLAYDLDMATISQSLAPAEFREMPIPLIGAISVPEGEGPFPVVVVLHGRHPRCYADEQQLQEVWPCPPGQEPRYDIGFAYLLDALSARGYLALAPSVNGAYTTTWGPGTLSLDEMQLWVDERLGQIVDLHLERLGVAGAADPVFGPWLDLSGKVDTSSIGLIAHSTAGHTANTLARDRALPIRALVLLAPMRFANAGPAADVPTALILSTCDGDRPDLPGQGYYEDARLQAERAAPFASVALAGANHNFYNAELAGQGIDDAQFVRNPDCATTRLSAEEQQEFLAALAVDHLDAAFGRLAAPPDFLALTAPAPATLYGRAVLVALAPPAERRLPLFDPPPNSGRPIPGSGESISFGTCEPGVACNEGLLQPGRPGSYRLTWERPGGKLILYTPVAFDSNGPEPYTILRLRIAVDPSHPANAAAEPITFSVVLTDGAVRESGGPGNVVAVPLTAPLPFPPASPYPGDGYRFTPVLAHDIRLPLSAFAPVELADLKTVELHFDDTPSGSILLLDAELWRGVQ